MKKKKVSDKWRIDTQDKIFATTYVKDLDITSYL